MDNENREEQVFQGIPASPGVARGPLFSFSEGELEVPRYTVTVDRLEEEIARFEQGLLATRKELSAIRAEVAEKLSEDEAGIFDAHMMVLEDRALIEDTIEEVRQTETNIETCFLEVSNRYMEAFAQIDDEYIKERVSDIRDVSKRLINNLLGRAHRSEEHSEAAIGQHVLVSEDLSPSETALLELGEVLAIVTEKGSRTSHSVIMARSLNIPCVVGLHGLLEVGNLGDEVLVDGYEGVVILNPEKATLERYGHLETEHQSQLQQFEAERTYATEGLCGTPFHLFLNIEGVEGEERIRNSGAAGVGLMRTENLFLTAHGFPGEEQQFAVYRDLAQALKGNPVTIRTLDIGGDKNPHRSLTDYKEDNPFMGYRGIRFCLDNPDVFHGQLRAILRASAFGKVRILYPMVCNVDEMRRANACLEEAKQSLRDEGIAFDEGIESGAMVEVPSTVAIMDLLAEECAFFSVGTNDLMQYMLAVDRGNDRIAHLYEACQPAVIRTLNFIFEQGRRIDRPVNVCGELGGDPLFAPLLLGMGAHELSVSLGAYSQVKYLLRRTNRTQLQALAERVGALSDTEAIRGELEKYSQALMQVAIS
jgi:phosphotransferase system enzyme I (PtsI)